MSGAWDAGGYYARDCFFVPQPVRDEGDTNDGGRRQQNWWSTSWGRGGGLARTAPRVRATASSARTCGKQVREQVIGGGYWPDSLSQVRGSVRVEPDTASEVVHFIYVCSEPTRIDRHTSQP